MKIKMYIYFCVFCFASLSCEGNASGLDYSLFDNTPIKDLARAVQDEDIEKIKILINERKLNVNYKEPKFGNNILMLAVVDKKNEVIETLLKLGADPNQTNNKNSKNAFVIAVEYSSIQNCGTEKIKILLNYGADVNSKWIDLRETRAGNIQDIQETSLMIACSNGCMDVVKLLIENGANINEYTKYEGYGAITNCLLQNNIEIAKYLIINKKAKIPNCIYIVPKNENRQSKQKKVTITDMLNIEDYNNDIANNDAKKQILDYLKKIKKK